MSDKHFPMSRSEINAQIKLCEQTMDKCRSIIQFSCENKKFNITRHQYARAAETYSICSLLLDSIYKVFDLDEDVESTAMYDVPKVYADAMFVVLKGAISSIKRFNNVNLSLEVH
jgi:hypothetical protein